MKYLVFLLCLLLFSNSSDAQDSLKIMYAKMGTQRMRQQFSLSKEQTSQLEVINIEFEEKMDSVSGIKMGDKRKGEAKDKIFQKREADLKKIFTPDQYAKYNQFLKDNIPEVPVSKPVDAEPGGFISNDEY